MTDPAYEWFREDARRQGLSIREYERRYGVMLREDGPAQRRVDAHEVAFSEIGHENAPAIADGGGELREAA